MDKQIKTHLSRQAVQLACYDNPYEYSKYTELYNKKGKIIEWGNDNMYPTYINQLFYKNPKHSSIVRTKAQMLGGNGWNKNGLTQAQLDFITNMSVDNKDLDLDEVLNLISYDVELYGGYALNIIWNIDFTRIAKIKYIPLMNVRFALPTEDNKVRFYVSDDWTNTKVCQPVLYNEFDPSVMDYSEQERLDNEIKASTIYFDKIYSPGNENYPLPEYISGEVSIVMGEEINLFKYKEITNGYFPAMGITFLGPEPTEEEKWMTARDLSINFEGARNAGKVITMWANDKDNAPIIQPIEQNNSNERFVKAREEMIDDIYAAHQINDPELFGKKEAGSLGSSQELQDSLAIFQSGYITPKQSIIEKAFNWFASINGLEPNFAIERYKLNIPIKVNVSELMSVITNVALDYETKKSILSILGYDQNQIDSLIKPTI